MIKQVYLCFVEDFCWCVTMQGYQLLRGYMLLQVTSPLWCLSPFKRPRLLPLVASRVVIVIKATVNNLHSPKKRPRPPSSCLVSGNVGAARVEPGLVPPSCSPLDPGSVTWQVSQQGVHKLHCPQHSRFVQLPSRLHRWKRLTADITVRSGY